MAKKQIKSADDGRALNDDVSARDDAKTQQLCRRCVRKFDSRKEPYTPQLCYRCFGLDSKACWRSWMREQFAAVAKARETDRKKVKARIVKCVAGVLLDPKVDHWDIWHGLNDAFAMTFGRDRDFFEALREELKTEIKLALKEVLEARRAAPEVVTVVRTIEVRKPDDQLTLHLDVVESGVKQITKEIVMAPKAVQVAYEEEQLKLNLFGR